MTIFLGETVSFEAFHEHFETSKYSDYVYPKPEIRNPVFFVPNPNSQNSCKLPWFTETTLTFSKTLSFNHRKREVWKTIEKALNLRKPSQAKYSCGVCYKHPSKINPQWSSSSIGLVILAEQQFALHKFLPWTKGSARSRGSFQAILEPVESAFRHIRIYRGQWHHRTITNVATTATVHSGMNSVNSGHRLKFEVFNSTKCCVCICNKCIQIAVSNVDPFLKMTSSKCF